MLKCDSGELCCPVTALIIVIYLFVNKFRVIIYIIIHDMGHVARKPDFVACEQRRHRPACSSAQFDQHLCYLLIGMHIYKQRYQIMTTIKLHKLFIHNEKNN